MLRKCTILTVIVILFGAIYVPITSGIVSYISNENLLKNNQTMIKENNGLSQYLDQYCKEPGLAFKFAYKNEEKNLFFAQSFKPSLPILTKINLHIGRFGGITSDLIFSIRYSLTGEDLVTISRPYYLITKHQLWNIFDIPDINVNIGETYYIILKTYGGNYDNDDIYAWSLSKDHRYWKGDIWLNWGTEWFEHYDQTESFCFETYGYDPNNFQPQTPVIYGEKKGSTAKMYEYFFTANDLDQDKVCFWIDWGDGTVDEWSEYVESGKQIMVSHKYDESGFYKISAIAKDVNGAESNWGEYNIAIIKERTLSNTHFLNMFLNFFSLFLN